MIKPTAPILQHFAAIGTRVDSGHGRLETLTIAVTDDISWLCERHD